MTLPILALTCLAIGYAIGRRPSEQHQANLLLLRARGERIKELEAEIALAEQQKQATFRAVEMRRGWS